MEQFKDLSYTYLSSDIDNVQSSIPVVDASRLPSVGKFRLLINSELLVVNSVSGNVLSATRGAEWTSPAAATSGTAAYHILTNGAIKEALNDRTAAGPLSGMTFATSGSIYIATDTNLLAVSADGVNAKYIGPLIVYTPPVSGNFSWINQGPRCRLSCTDQYMNMTPTVSASIQLRILETPMPSGSWTLTACIVCAGILADYNTWGICARDSNSGRVRTLCVLDAANQVSSQYMVCQKYANATTYDSDVLGLDPGIRYPRWFRLRDDTVNHIWSVSRDGLYWDVFVTESRTSWLAAPDRVGWFADSRSTIWSPSITLLHWKIE